VVTPVVVFADAKPQIRPTQATVVVELPADATLYVDGQKAEVTSGRRTVVTPELKPGQDYYYTIKAEAVRDGQAVVKTEQVAFRAGQAVTVRLGELSASAPAQAAPSRVTVRLPEDARLSVDGVACPLTSTVRTFDTPALQPGKAYHYTLKAEVVRDGKTRTESKQVVLGAGKDVEVEFNGLAPIATASR